MNWNDWVKKYKPIKNPYNAWDSIQFETYGEDWDYVKDLDEHHVWTAIDVDDDVTVAGRAFVNRLHYYVTEIAWEDKDMELEVVDEDYEKEEDE